MSGYVCEYKTEGNESKSITHELVHCSECKHYADEYHACVISSDWQNRDPDFWCRDGEYGYSEEPNNFMKAENDQTIKADAGKLMLTLVPRKIIWAIAKIRQYGIKKYGSSENWMEVDVERYRNAAFRHFLKYLDCPGSVDKESGLPHLYHCCCNLAFLCELEGLGNESSYFE